MPRVIRRPVRTVRNKRGHWSTLLEDVASPQVVPNRNQGRDMHRTMRIGARQPVMTVLPTARTPRMLASCELACAKPASPLVFADEGPTEISRESTTSCIGVARVQAASNHNHNLFAQSGWRLYISITRF